jgi:hypothetical protein
VTEVPDLPTKTREVGPADKMRGLPPAHQEGHATRTTTPSPTTGMVHNTKDVSGSAADQADETWLPEAVGHVSDLRL